MYMKGTPTCQMFDLISRSRAPSPHPHSSRTAGEMPGEWSVHGNVHMYPTHRTSCDCQADASIPRQPRCLDLDHLHCEAARRNDWRVCHCTCRHSGVKKPTSAMLWRGFSATTALCYRCVTLMARRSQNIGSHTSSGAAARTPTMSWHAAGQQNGCWT